jgi:hypothetical protein
MRTLDLRWVPAHRLPLRLARLLRFPPWFGGTWDGVEDCLRDRAPVRLRIIGADAFARRDPRAWGIFADLARERRVTVVTVAPIGGWRPGNGPLAPRARRRP